MIISPEWIILPSLSILARYQSGRINVMASKGIPDVAVAGASVNLAQKSSRNCRWNQWPWRTSFAHGHRPREESFSIKSLSAMTTISTAMMSTHQILISTFNDDHFASKSCKEEIIFFFLIKLYEKSKCNVIKTGNYLMRCIISLAVQLYILLRYLYLTFTFWCLKRRIASHRNWMRLRGRRC